jgi:hypothetical protein
MNLKNCKKGCAETLKIEKNGGKMASWLETFISKYNNKVTAETNVKNLPKVNWKDETFYVNFWQIFNISFGSNFVVILRNKSF